jgi:hypothetical protein
VRYHRLAYRARASKVRKCSGVLGHRLDDFSLPSTLSTRSQAHSASIPAVRGSSAACFYNLTLVETGRTVILRSDAAVTPRAITKREVLRAMQICPFF